MFYLPVKEQRKQLENRGDITASVVRCKNCKVVRPGRFTNQSSCFQTIQSLPIHLQTSNRSSPIFIVKSGKFSRVPLHTNYSFNRSWFQTFPEDFLPSPRNVEQIHALSPEPKTGLLDFDTESHCHVSTGPYQPQTRQTAMMPLRPTLKKAMPLQVSDPLFTVFHKTINLRLLPFGRSTDAFKFYTTHYPLLLCKIPSTRSSTPSPRKRRTSESPMSAIIYRKQDLRERMGELNLLLDQLEEEDSQQNFVTELRDDIFDPTTYSWN